MTVCSTCGDPIQRTIARPQYGTAPHLPYPRGVGQRPFVHTNYLKQYDHEAERRAGSETNGEGR